MSRPFPGTTLSLPPAGRTPCPSLGPRPESMAPPSWAGLAGQEVTLWSWPLGVSRCCGPAPPPPPPTQAPLCLPSTMASGCPGTLLSPHPSGSPSPLHALRGRTWFCLRLLTTPPRGAAPRPSWGRPSPSYWAALDGVRSLILPGNDDGGALHAATGPPSPSPRPLPFPTQAPRRPHAGPSSPTDTLSRPTHPECLCPLLPGGAVGQKGDPSPGPRHV